jgi:hypothetical protein
LKLSTRITGVFALVAIGAILAHLFKPANMPPLGIALLHSLHGPGFAVLAVVFLWGLQAHHYSKNNYWVAGTAAIIIGVLSEAAQIIGPRDASLADIAVDGLGIFGALWFVAFLDPSVRRGLSRTERASALIATGVALLLTCVPTLWYSYSLFMQQRAFPELLTFDHNWEKATYELNGNTSSELVSTVDRGKVARSKQTGEWGIFLSVTPWPDWREYSRLVFAAAAVRREFPVVVCLRDMQANSITEDIPVCVHVPVTLNPSEYTVEFQSIRNSSRNPPFDFSRVSALVFSAVDADKDDELVLDAIRLER